MLLISLAFAASTAANRLGNRARDVDAAAAAGSWPASRSSLSASRRIAWASSSRSMKAASGSNRPLMPTRRTRLARARSSAAADAGYRGPASIGRNRRCVSESAPAFVPSPVPAVWCRLRWSASAARPVLLSPVSPPPPHGSEKFTRAYRTLPDFPNRVVLRKPSRVRATGDTGDTGDRVEITGKFVSPVGSVSPVATGDTGPSTPRRRRRSPGESQDRLCIIANTYW